MKVSVFIYQVGKVGSLTVLDSLVAGGFRRFGEDTLHEDFDGPRVIHTHRHEVVEDYVKAHPDEDIVIISLVREFLRTNISAFFQNIDNIEHEGWYVGDMQRVQSLSANELVKKFRKRHLKQCRVLTDWFSKFEESAGVPIFDRPFPHELGYTTRTVGRVRLCIVRTENLSHSMEALGTSIGRDDFTLCTPVHLSADKWYAPLYSAFLEHFKPTAAEIKKYYRNPTMQWFYSPIEIEAMIAQWSKSPEERRYSAFSAMVPV